MNYEVPLDVRGFPSWVPAPSGLSVSDELLIWAAATLGERKRVPRNADLVRRANRRVSTLYDAFSTTCGCHLTHSQNYLSNLDPSDRSVISYLLGGISAKLAASLLVGVPYLVHYDAVLKEHGQPLRGRRPDFVGVGSPPISVRVTVEAKGTVGSVNSALADGVDQAKGAGRRSRPRRLAWGQQAHFDDIGWGEPIWSATLVDPPADDFVFPRTQDLLIAYFAPLIRDLFSEYFVVPDQENNSWWVASLEGTGVQIAIRGDAAGAALDADGETLTQLCGLEDRGQPEEDPSSDEVGATLANDPVRLWGAPIWPQSANSAEGFVAPDGIAIRILGG